MEWTNTEVSRSEALRMGVRNEPDDIDPDDYATGDIDPALYEPRDIPNVRLVWRKRSF